MSKTHNVVQFLLIYRELIFRFFPHIYEKDPEKVDKLASPTRDRTVFNNINTVKIFINPFIGFYILNVKKPDQRSGFLPSYPEVQQYSRIAGARLRDH